MNKPYEKSLHDVTPWNDLDEDGSLTYRMTQIELQKEGIALSSTPINKMTRSELLNERNKLRRITSDFSAKSSSFLVSGNAADSERYLKFAEETSRISALLSRQLDLNEIANGAQRSGNGNQYSAADGRRIQVLGRNDQLADLSNSGDRTEFGFGEYVSAMVRGTGSQSVRNALAEGTDSAGGYTVPKRLMADVIDKMRARTTVIQAGALTIPLESQTTTIARIASDPAAGWRLENAAVAESDPTFEGVTFTARSLAVLVKVSRELLDDSVNIDQALASAFAGAMAVEADRVALFGSGTAPEPRGIYNTANVNSVSMGTNGAQITNHSKLLDCLYELQADNASKPTAQIMHPRTWRTIAGFADTTGQPLQAPAALATLPQLVSTTVPVNQVQGTSGATCSSVIVGDFSQLLIGVRQELRIEVVRDLFAGNLQYGFIAHLRMDVAVAHPESFCKLVGILP